MSLLDSEHISARMAIVDEHIACENRADNRLAGECIYYDRGTVLGQAALLKIEASFTMPLI